MLGLVILFGLLFAAPTTLSAQEALRREELGGCLIIHLREMQKPAPDLRRFCEGILVPMPQGTRFHDLYGWTPPFLAAALDEAERASCGNLGCATAKRHVRITLIPNGFVNAGITGDTQSLDIVIHSGLVDFVEATVGSFLRDMTARQSGNVVQHGFAQWLGAMTAASGQPCASQVRTPFRPVSEAEFKQIRVAAQTVYMFVFAHEFAHIVHGPRCSEKSNDPLSVEKACDRIAIRNLIQRNIALPIFGVAVLTAMQHYEALVGPRLYTLFKDPYQPDGIRLIFTARDWRARAAELVREWEAACQSGNQGPMCLQGWQDPVKLARSYLALDLPKPCAETDRPGVLLITQASPTTDLCTGLAQLIDASATDFQRLRGTQDGDFWDGTLKLAGTDECTVYGGGDIYYGCSTIKSSTREAALAAYQSLANRIATCLPNWRVEKRQRTEGRLVTYFTPDTDKTEVAVRLTRLRMDEWYAQITVERPK